LSASSERCGSYGRCIHHKWRIMKPTTRWRTLLLLLAVLYMDCNIVPCRECWTLTLCVHERKAISGYHDFPLFSSNHCINVANYVSVSVRKCGCFVMTSMNLTFVEFFVPIFYG
jgi:hypothetical protein